MRSRTRPSENTNKERAWGDEASMLAHSDLVMVSKESSFKELSNGTKFNLS